MNSDNASPTNANDQIYFSHAVSSTTAAAMKTKVGDNISNLLALERKIAHENGTPLISLSSSVLLLQSCDIICNRFLYNRCDVAVFLRNHDSCDNHGFANVTPPVTPPRQTTAEHNAFSSILPNGVPIMPPALIMSNKIPLSSSPDIGIGSATNEIPASPAASIGAFISSIGKTVLGYNEDEYNNNNNNLLSSPARGTSNVSDSSICGVGVAEIKPTDDTNIGNNCALLFRGGNNEWQRFLIGTTKTKSPNSPNSTSSPDANANQKEQNRWSMFQVSPLELLIVIGCIRNKLAFAANESASQPVHILLDNPSPIQQTVASGKSNRRRGSAPAVVFSTSDMNSDKNSTKSTKSTSNGRSKVALSSAPLCHTNMLYIISCILSPWMRSETIALYNNNIGLVSGVETAVLKLLTESSGICVVTDKNVVDSFNMWSQQACTKNPDNWLKDSNYPLLKPQSYSTEIMIKMTNDLSGIVGRVVTTAVNTTIVHFPRSVPTSPTKDTKDMNVCVSPRSTPISTANMNTPTE